MAEYNSAYTGAQIDEAVGAVVGGTLAKKSEAVRFGTITLPKGRVKGDINGDGVISPIDSLLASSIAVGNYTPTDIEHWCADVDGDGNVTVIDSININKIIKGSYSGTLLDYYENWTYDATTKQWMTEVQYTEMTTSSNVFIYKSEFDKILNIEPQDGSLKVYVSIPPTSDMGVVIEYGDGIGTAKVVDDLTHIFIATYGKTTVEELQNANIAEKIIICIKGSNHTLASFTNKDSSYHYFGPDKNGDIYICQYGDDGVTTVWSTVKAMDQEGFAHASNHAAGGSDPITPESIGAAPAILSHSVTLTAAGWNATSKTQTVTVADILADVTKQEIHAMPVDASAGNAYDTASIRPVAQAANSLTFYAETIPTADIGVYVAIHPLKFS